MCELCDFIKQNKPIKETKKVAQLLEFGRWYNCSLCGCKLFVVKEHRSKFKANEAIALVVAARAIFGDGTRIHWKRKRGSKHAYCRAE